MPKPYWEKCSRGKLLRKVIAEAPPSNVILLSGRSEAETRLQLIEAGKAYCVARCGGCPLTDGFAPP